MFLETAGGAAAIGALGNIAGAKLSHFANMDLQGRQFAEQEELQRNAAKLNATAVRNQAQLQAQSLQNAGLNPAAVTGAGAPSVQAGAAAGSTSQLGNVFSGLAELIAAAKAPSEIEKTVAETNFVGAQTEKTGAETRGIEQQVNHVVPQLMEKTGKEIDSLGESIRNAKNVNDAFEAQDKFLREHSSAVFDQMRTRLKDKGFWDSLAPNTRATLERLADGDITIGTGEYDGLVKAIDSQMKLSNADKDMIKNAFDSNVLLRQYSDAGVMKALTKLPEDVRNELYTRIKKMNQEIQGIVQDIKTSKTQADLNKALEKLNTFRRESEELDDVKWLAKKMRNDDVDIKTSEQSLENIWDLIKSWNGVVQSAVGGYAAGRGLGYGRQSENKPNIFAPTPAEMDKVNRPRSFKESFDFGDNHTQYRNWR